MTKAVVPAIAPFASGADEPAGPSDGRALRVIMVFPDPPLPFGDAGGRGYYILLKGLVERGHRVTVFCGSSNAELHRAEVAKVFPAGRYDVRVYPHAKRAALNPISKFFTLFRPYSYMFCRELRQDLELELARGFDALQLNQLWTGWVGMGHTDRAVLQLHYLFSIDLAGGADLTIVEKIQRFIASRAERHLIKRYKTISTLTDRIARNVRLANKTCHLSVIPTGLDLSLYEFPARQKNQGPPVLGLIGSFHWEPTISAADRLLNRLWPEIKRQVPDVRLRIVGRKAKSKLTAWLNSADIEVEEDVPDIKPHFHGIDVMLYAPRVGSGMKVKITESMALGAAVVTNADGVEGLNVTNGVQADVTDDDAELIAATVRLLKDPELRQRRRVAARRLVELMFDVGKTVEKFESLYRRALARKN